MIKAKCGYTKAHFKSADYRFSIHLLTFYGQAAYVAINYTLCTKCNNHKIDWKLVTWLNAHRRHNNNLPALGTKTQFNRHSTFSS